MANNAEATTDVLKQTLDQYGSKLNLQYNSKVLVSDANVARTIYAATESVRSSFGPHITVASRGQQIDDLSSLQNVTVTPLESVERDHFTHAIFGLAGEDPKFILEGMKWMIYALQPKGVAIVTALKLESGQAEGQDGQYTLGLEDKLLYQSKGKISNLSGVLEYAGFERGKIRANEKTTQVDGKKVDADVVVAMKWDQLTG